MLGIRLIPFKVSVPKPKRERNTSGITRVSNKIHTGKVFKDEDGVYKIAINMHNDTVNPDLRILEFTERSYNLKGKTEVFRREPDERGSIVRYIRNEFDAKCMPGSKEIYIPFAEHWIVKGYIVSENKINKFDFKGLVCIDGYEQVNRLLEE